MARTIETTVFSFDELSDRAKERARDWWRACENDDFDPDCVLEDAATIASLLGINLDTQPVKLMGGGTRYKPKIYYSGFSSQGDGASFEGSYSYAKGSVAKVKAHAPVDATLHRIASDLARMQKANFYGLAATIKQSGRYSHSGTMAIEVENTRARYVEIGDDVEGIVKQAMRDFADWIYRQLEAEYEYRMSNENVDDAIRINEYEFNENGSIAR